MKSKSFAPGEIFRKFRMLKQDFQVSSGVETVLLSPVSFTFLKEGKSQFAEFRGVMMPWTKQNPMNMFGGNREGMRYIQPVLAARSTMDGPRVPGYQSSFSSVVSKPPTGESPSAMRVISKIEGGKAIPQPVRSAVRHPHGNGKQTRELSRTPGPSFSESYDSAAKITTVRPQAETARRYGDESERFLMNKIPPTVDLRAKGMRRFRKEPVGSPIKQPLLIKGEERTGIPSRAENGTHTDLPSVHAHPRAVRTPLVVQEPQAWLAAKKGSIEPTRKSSPGQQQSGTTDPQVPEMSYRVQDSDEFLRSIGAVAAVKEGEIHIARDAPGPSTTQGRAILAHEITHVIQQENLRRSPTMTAPGPDTLRAMEAEALVMEASVLAGNEPFFDTAQMVHKVRPGPYRGGAGSTEHLPDQTQNSRVQPKADGELIQAKSLDTLRTPGNAVMAGPSRTAMLSAAGKPGGEPNAAYATGGSPTDIDEISEQVYRKILERLTQEMESRGMS